MELFMLASNEIAGRLKGQTFGNLEEKLKAAMRLTKNHWMVTGDEDRFKAAIGAVLLKASEEEKERIEAGLAPLKALAAMATGVPVDFAAMMEKLPDDLLPIKKLWDEVKSEKDEPPK